jgi:hypothetical protein
MGSLNRSFVVIVLIKSDDVKAGIIALFKLSVFWF